MVFFILHPINVNLIQLSFHLPMLREFFTWDTCSTIPFRIFWYGVHACRGKMPAGSPEPIMLPLLLRPKLWKSFQQKELKNPIFHGKSFLPTLGNGPANMVVLFWNSLKNWALHATGIAPLLRWTKFVPKA